MKTLLTLLSVFALTLGLGAQTPPFTMPKSYSADMKTTMKDGPTVESKIFHSDSKIRTEMNQQGMKIISIVRPDQKKIYSIMVDQKMYMEMPFNPKQDPTAALQDAESKFEKVGTETVNNVACDKYKITSKAGEAFIFISQDKKQMVRLQTADGKVTTDWSNMKEGAQDAALFEPPADFQKMELPAGMVPPEALEKAP